MLYVTGQIKFMGINDAITINAGASLTIYNAGASGVFNFINNANSTPDTFQYYGLPSNTSLTLRGQDFLVAAVYAPNADFFMNGGGTTYGSIVANSAKLTGSGTFHFDECLINKGKTRGFIITSWNEL